MEDKISAGSYDLNKWLFGGYERDIITTIYGPAGSGKTNMCMLAAVSQAKKSSKVIYIDSEGGFSLERFKQIAGKENEKAVENILLMNPMNFSEQKKIFDSLAEKINSNSKIGLIIVDSMAMLYRLEIAEAGKEDSEEKIRNINKELAKQLRILAEIARRKNIPVIVTNQVYYNFLTEEEFRSGAEKKANMVGGDLLKYWSKCLIEIEIKKGRRNMNLIKHRSLPEKEMPFIIVNEGIKKRGYFGI